MQPSTPLVAAKTRQVQTAQSRISFKPQMPFQHEAILNQGVDSSAELH
jgi:hypothetical protein